MKGKWIALQKQLDERFMRINPDTKKIFVSGDTRPVKKAADGYKYPQDDKIFTTYANPRRQATGLYKEIWLNPDSVKAKNLLRQSYPDNRIRYKIADVKKGLVKGIKAGVNADGLVLERGDTKELNGRTVYFQKFLSTVNKKNYLNEIWSDWDNYLAQNIRRIHRDIVKRSQRNNKICDITEEYLIDIFPRDKLCPILGSEICFGNRTPLARSPSVDRINNDLGYIEGNVAWISHYANRRKGDMSSDELKRLIELVERRTK